MAKKKVKLTKKQLNVLYECWKNGNNIKERLVLIEKNLAKVPPLVALSIMRHMAKTDTKWLKMATRKKNQQEKEKLKRKKEQEKKKCEVKRKKIEREERRKKRTRLEAQKKKLKDIKNNLQVSYLSTLEEKIEPKFFFCPDTHQFVHNLSCIFRIFSDEFHVSLGPECEKCSRMDKFIPIIEEVINDGGQKKIRRYTPSKGGCKTKKKRKQEKSKRTKKS